MADTPPPVLRILETSLYVAALERSEMFYRRVFGYTTLFRDERMCALAVPDRQVLLLFRQGGAGVPSHTPFGTIPPHDGHGHLHLCFAITREAIAAWERHLAELEIAVESRVDWPSGAISLYFRDLDGHSLEVGTRGLWGNDPV